MVDPVPEPCIRLEAPMENAHGVKSWKLYDTENALVVHLQLEPGESLKPHITPVDVFFYVLEGTGVVLVGKEKLEVSEGTLVESPKDIVVWNQEIFERMY